MAKRRKVTFKTKYGKVTFMAKTVKNKKSKFDVMREEKKKGFVV